MTIDFQIHWLSFTVHTVAEVGFNLYNEIFRDSFGELEELGHGGRGYKTILKATLEIKMYLDPITRGQKHFHIEIPGKACEAIKIDTYRKLIGYLESEYEGKYKICRLDCAFDHVPFQPQQVYDAIMSGQIRSNAKRASLKITKSPLARRENGELGTTTVEFGHNTSNQMITVYDKRGFTRLEFQTKDERATAIAVKIFGSVYANRSGEIALEHLLDFVDFRTDWWEKFKKEKIRANLKVSKPSEVAKEKTFRWLKKQVAPALSAINDAVSEGAITALISEGRRRRGNKYSGFFVNKS
jgi:DNA relaxase NicK